MSVQILFTALWLGFFAAGATVFIRVLPFIAFYVERGTKPWACDKCMSFWLLLFSAGGLPSLANTTWGTHLVPFDFALAAPAAYAISLLMLRRLTDPLGPPPSFAVPELTDTEPPLDGTRYQRGPFSDPPNH